MLISFYLPLIQWFQLNFWSFLWKNGLEQELVLAKRNTEGQLYEELIGHFSLMLLNLNAPVSLCGWDIFPRFFLFFLDPYEDDDLKVKTQRPRSADQPGVFQAQTGKS